MRRVGICTVLLLVVASGCGNGTDSPTATTSPPSTSTTATSALPALPFGDDLQRLLDASVGGDGNMGASLAVMVPGHKPWLGVAGYSEPGIPVRTGMAFGAASTSKNFTAALVLQLAEEGKLSLDDQLREWLPEHPNIDSSATIRQLLNHTSGIFTVNHHPDFWRAVFADGTRVWTDEELLTTFVAEPYSAPGNEWHYSNTGYTLAGQIIEEATGRTVSAALRDRFFEPLGLTSAFYLSEETAPVDIAEGWFDIDTLVAEAGSLKPAPERFSDYPWLAALPEAGGIFASARDLAVWADALFHDQTVLTTESLDQMLDWVVVPTTAEEAQLIAGYGVGAIRYNPELFDGSMVIGHSGGGLFYSAVSGYLPDYGVCIGAAQNGETGDGFGVMVTEVVALIAANVASTP